MKMREAKMMMEKEMKGKGKKPMKKKQRPWSSQNKMQGK